MKFKEGDLVFVDDGYYQNYILICQKSVDAPDLYCVSVMVKSSEDYLPGSKVIWFHKYINMYGTKL